MRGALLLNDKDFYVTISAQRERLTKIIRVAGETREIAKGNKREPNIIRAHGIHTNIGGLSIYKHLCIFLHEKLFGTWIWKSICPDSPINILGRHQIFPNTVLVRN